MRLTVFNGSPRGVAGNTARMLEPFLEGFGSVEGNSAEVVLLCRDRDNVESVKSYEAAESVLLAFPLYVDAMPAMVKAFIEKLEPFSNREDNPPLLFFVHSGFPEAGHSRPVERYLRRLAGRLGSQYQGTIIKPGSEGVRLGSKQMMARLFRRLEKLGRIYGQEQRLDPKILKQLSEPERLGPLRIAFFGALNIIGLNNRYWDNMLRDNGAFEKRYEQPYIVNR